MTDEHEITALERRLRPMARAFSLDLARALVDVQADAETQARYDELADKCSAGHLVAEERAELEDMVRANTSLGLLKVEAHALSLKASE